MIWFALVALPAVALRSVFYACASAIFAFHFCYSLIWNMKIEYPFWKLVFEGFKGTKIQKAAVIAAFVLPMKGKFVLKVSVLIVEFKPSPNLKHYHLAERTGFEPCSAIYLRIRYFLFHLLWQVTIWILSVHFLSEPVSKNLYYTANINILFYLRKLFLFFCIQKSSIGCCLVVRVLFKQAE